MSFKEKNIVLVVRQKCKIIQMEPEYKQTLFSETKKEIFLCFITYEKKS